MMGFDMDAKVEKGLGTVSGIVETADGGVFGCSLM